MTGTRTLIGACALALLAGCSGGKAKPNAAAARVDTSMVRPARKATHRPKILQPIDRARAVSDSMAARAARMNAQTDSIIH